MIIRYRKGSERPDITLTWRSSAGTVIDFSQNTTFEFKLGSPGKSAIFTKTVNIIGGQTAPNVTVSFISGELDALPTGRYVGQLRARDTVTGQDRFMLFWFYFLDSIT